MIPFSRSLTVAVLSTLGSGSLLLPSARAVDAIPTTTAPFASPVRADAEPMADGKFAPTWDSLKQYQVPDWFRDAKFGIWAHWGPQCQPERGDWYAREMYLEGSAKYRAHLQAYGHPSEVGFKDVIHAWKAEHWDPDKLIALYKRAGAQYFFALANHHDNFDLWNSKYQPWNSVKLGPEKDIIGGWARAARANGLKFGVSVHAAHAWSWYEPAQGADRRGDKAGLPYDGKLTRADGPGKWWDGLDPQDLYEQRHPPAPDFLNGGSISARWNWGRGLSTPDIDYCTRFYNRTIDLINQHHPDLIYFDDTALPLYPVSDAGLKLAAHFYNSNMKLHDGRLEAVLFGKILAPDQRQCMVWDIERGQSNQIEPYAWQTDTCIGGWHYDRALLTNHRYKSAKTVIQTLADVVSKNGNLLLSVPLRGDGALDDDELKVVNGIADWMAVNKEAIFATRPWKIFGEGPSVENASPLQSQGFNEGKGKPFTAEDIRFTSRGNILYAIVMGVPDKTLRIKSLGGRKNLGDLTVSAVELLGTPGSLQWTSGEDALTVQMPSDVPAGHTLVFKIMLK